jgi:subtilisin family serine protease
MIKDYNPRENHNSQESKSRREKENNLRKYWAGAIIIIAVLLLVAYFLWFALFRLEPAVECKTETKVLGRIPPTEMIIPTEPPFLVPNQVIVTGPPSEVDKVVEEVNADPTLDLELVLIKKCDLNYLSDKDPKRQYFPSLGNARGVPTMRLYHIPGGQPVEDVIGAIEKKRGNRKISADPNLLIGNSASVCGDPNSGGGSPFGAPKLLDVGEEAAVKLFWEQWAFQQADVGPSLKDELDGAAIMHQGEGVIVGVFDTSPFPDPWDSVANGQKMPTTQHFPWPGAEVLMKETKETVKWVNPTMDVEPLALKVSYPKIVNTLTVTATDGITSSTVYSDVRDHGLFVAGLVHAVAPASEIRLIKVLNEAGCGDLFTLNAALGHFIGELEEDKGIVINLSLGVYPPEEDVILNECDPDAPVETDIGSLCKVLSSARDKGAVIVAAAGNDSGKENEQRLPAQVPAAYDFVIGASASNHNYNLACFSNEGDVSAPGGDGGPVTGDDGSPVNGKPCVSKVEYCAGDSDCEEAVISLVLFPPKRNAYWSTHYGYWSGTSFSAPLVSGLAALILQAGVTLADEGSVPATNWPDLVQVTTTIHCGTVPPPDGVINVPNTLTDCLP